MVKKSLLAAGLAVLTLGVGRPAAAGETPPPTPSRSSPGGALWAPVFFDSYGDMFGARTFLGVPGDGRPKDARQGQASRLENPTERWAFGPFARDTDDDFLVGGGIAYANVRNPKHPWSLNVNYFRLSLDGVDDHFNSFDVVGKLVLSQPANPNQPVLSLVGRYLDPDDLGEQIAVLAAIDQRVTKELFVTGNAGWLDNRGAGFDETGLLAAVGATWSPARWPRFSLAANYVFDSDAVGEDTYSVSGILALGQMSSLQVGGGKSGKIFASFIAKFDR